MAQFTFEAIGTAWQIDMYQELGDAAAAKLLSRVRERIELFDATYSRFRADSLVTRMSREPGTFALPPDAEPLLALYRDLYERTGGLFTPLVGDMLSDAGYDADYSLRQKKELAAAPSWDETFEYAAGKLTMQKPAMLDFGAAGKGCLVDLVAEVLEESGISSYCIDAGGDILYKGAEPIRVGLEDPESAGKAVGVSELKDGSICGSAGNRRAWGNFTHIMHPKEALSPKGVLAVWVTAKQAMFADAIATCLFFVPAETLKEKYDFEYVIVRAGRILEKSENFRGEVFIASQ